MLVLCGKSAAGKNYMLNELIKQGMKRVITYTTRPMRKGEKDGVDYHFISEWLFDKLKNDNFFAETAEYHVASKEIWKYGSAISDYKNSTNSVIILNPEGIKQIKKKNIPICAFCLEASKNTRLYRLSQRGDDLDEVNRRLEADDRDFKDIKKYVQYIVFTDKGIDTKCMAKEIIDVYKLYINDLEKDNKNGTVE